MQVQTHLAIPARGPAHRQARSRLLILACSGRKRPVPGPALELYDGVLWRVLRRAQREGAAPVRVLALSAKYGLVPAEQVLEPYELRMTSTRALELAPTVRQRLASYGPVTEVYVEVGHDYLPALPPAAGLALLLHASTVRYGQGPIGVRGHLLKAWLTAATGWNEET